MVFTRNTLKILYSDLLLCDFRLGSEIKFREIIILKSKYKIGITRLDKLVAYLTFIKLVAVKS